MQGRDVLVVLLAAVACKRGQRDGDFSAAAISADIRALADDRFEGRGTGTPGERLAQTYVSDRFAADGVAPGAGSGYLAPVRLLAAKIAPGTASVGFHAPGKPEVAFESIVPIPDGRTAQIELDAPAVFVGYAISAPELGHDDLAHVDLHGKIAVFFANAPDSLPPTPRALYSDQSAKYVHLAALGAVGAIVVWHDEKRLPWTRLATSAAGERLYVQGDDGPVSSPAGARALMPISELWRLVDAAGIAHDTLDHGPVDLGLSIHAHWNATFETRESANVVGLVRGRDPALAAEYVVYTAHLDHLGKNPALSGDQIMNGAIDNASGVATLLQVARAFAHNPAARSALFVATTGEEKGFLGSLAFVAHPPVPREAMVVNLNIDEVPGFQPLHDVVVLGVETTTLGDAARAAATALGLTVSPDPEPQEGYFGRGDNLRFAQAGIPAVRIEPGELDAKGDLAFGRHAHAEFVAKRYHTPSDDWRADDNFESMAQFARFAFELGARIANDPTRPARSTGAALQWETDEARAFARARTEHKGVLVDFYAAWCTPCDELDRGLRAPAVAAALAPSFVPLRLDVSEDSEAAVALKARYHAQTLPALVFVSTEGTVIDRITRVIDEAEITALVQHAAQRVGPAPATQ